MRIFCAAAIVLFASACATTPQASAPVPVIPAPSTPATSSTTTTTTTTATTPTVAPVAIPLDLAGRTVARVDQELRALGFTVLRYLGPDGSQVGLNPSWTVVSVDGAGSSAAPDSVVTIRVDRPVPPPPPKTSTKTTPKPAPPKPPQQVAPAPPKPAPPAAVYYKNCAAARAAGAAPVRVGQPGYGRHLDRDGDGVGCE